MHLCCLFGLVGDKMKVDMLFGGADKDSALLLSPQVSSRCLFSPPLLTPIVSPLCISFYLIYPLPSSFDSSLYISPHILSFALLSIHLSQFLVSLRHHLTPHLLLSVISYFDSCMYIWSTLNSSLLDFSHLLFCCLISYLISCL